MFKHISKNYLNDEIRNRLIWLKFPLFAYGLHVNLFFELDLESKNECSSLL